MQQKKPFLAGFYFKDLILEIVSIDLLGYLLLYFSTGLTGCYSFRLFYYTLCGDFNLTNFYNTGEENKNILFGMLTLFKMVILGVSLIRLIIFPTPSIICLPAYLKTIVWCHRHTSVKLLLSQPMAAWTTGKFSFRSHIPFLLFSITNCEILLISFDGK